MHTTENTEPPRFLCDEMLAGLARWLRAAGYDTLMCHSGATDRDILELALAEKRWLLTRDNKLSEIRNASQAVICLRSNSIDDCARELKQKLGIDWLMAPFTRCLECNCLLIEAEPAALARVPEESQKLANPLLYCPNCDKVFWQGSHVERMRNKLEKWSTTER